MIDIYSKGGYPANALSNFYAHEFTFDGIYCRSFESWLQAIKEPNEKKRQAICQLPGREAKRVGQHHLRWHLTRKAYWLDQVYDRHSDALQLLIDRAYLAMYEQSESFRAALRASGTEELAHSIGKENGRKTILTTNEFLRRLNMLRDKLLREDALLGRNQPCTVPLTVSALLSLPTQNQHSIVRSLLEANSISYGRLYDERQSVLNEYTKIQAKDSNERNNWFQRYQGATLRIRKYEDAYIKVLRAGEIILTEHAEECPSAVKQAFTLVANGKIDEANHQLALSQFQDAILTADKAKEKDKVRALLLSSLWTLKLDSLSAQQMSDENKEYAYLSLRLFDDNGEVYEQFADFYISTDRQGEGFEVMLEFVEKAKSIAQSTYICALHMALPIYYKTNKFDHLLPTFQYLIEYYQGADTLTENELAAFAKLMFQYSILSHNMELDHAETNYTKALQLFDQLRERDNTTNLCAIGHLLNGLGCLYMEKKQFEEADANFKRAVECFSQTAISEENPMDISLAMLYNNMSILSRHKGDDKTAMREIQYSAFIADHLSSLTGEYEEMAQTIRKNTILTRFLLRWMQPFDLF